MMILDPKKNKTIVLSNDEYKQLRHEIIEVFCKSEKELSKDRFPFKRMKKIFPSLAKILVQED